MVILSPGVYTRTIDLSAYVPVEATARAGMVGSASKGPVGTPTLITDVGTLINTFGPPSADHLGLFAAIEYLYAGNQLIYTRVASYGVATAVGTLDADAASPIVTRALSAGTWGNSISVVIGTGTDADTYKITVQYGGNPVETYDLVVLGAGNANALNYIETRINGVSDYITVSDAGTHTELTNGTYTLAGGANGTPVASADVIGSYGSPPVVPSSGIHCYDNRELISIDMILAPGRSESSVISALVTLAESRKDCMALIDPPFGLSVANVVAWHNGTSGLANAPTAALTSSYAALHWPWCQVFDSYNGNLVWLPPSGHVAQTFAKTDALADPWYAPAGLNRGQLTDVRDVEHSATQGERDYMYSNGNAVNPICKPYGNSGLTMFGQRTLQRLPTALDRINVRRLMIYVERTITEICQTFIMEPNDRFTWMRFVDAVDPFLGDLKNRRALYQYGVVCDATTNPPAVQDRNEMRANIFLQPVKAAEAIQVTFVLLPTGASFSEIV